MAVRTTSQAGDWSNVGTWTGGVPGDGDQAVLNHNVTVDVDTTVGTSPAGDGLTEIAIESDTSAGQLTIANNVTLTVKGPIVMHGPNVLGGPGSTIVFDKSSQGAATWPFRLGGAHFERSKLVFNGTSDNRAEMKCEPVGGRSDLGSINFIGGGACDCSFTTFTNWGRIGWWPEASPNSYQTFFDDCIFDNCDKIWTLVQLVESNEWRMQRCTVENDIGTSLDLRCSATAGAGFQDIISCYFSGTVDFFPVGPDLSITETFFGDIVSLTGTDQWAECSDCVFLIDQASGEATVAGDVTDCAFVSTLQLNPHLIGHLTDITVDGCVFMTDQTDSGGDPGDCVLLYTGGATTATVRNCLMTPNADGNGWATIVSALGVAGASMSVDSCTFYGPGAAVGETYSGHSGMLTSFKDNLVVAAAGETTYKLFDSGSDDTVSDLVTSANANYNAGFGITAGSNGKGYNNLEFSSGSPGANDIDGVDPAFVDDTREYGTWGQVVHSTNGTYSAANALFLNRHKPGGDSSIAVADMVSWVKAGWAPTADEYFDNSSTGSFIGAVQPVVLPSVTTNKGVRLQGPLESSTFNSISSQKIG